MVNGKAKSMLNQYTSTVIKNVNPVKTGKIYKASGVVRSVNQYAPPVLNDGTFSAMLVTYKKEECVF